MPRGRFLSRDVSTSERLANLSSDFARLLWTWGVAHADRDGRLPGNPRVLRAVVCPLLDVSTSQIAEAIKDLVKCRLVKTYDTADGTTAIQIAKFRAHQQGIRYSREAPSKYGPGPDRNNSGPTPPEVKLSKVNLSKDQVKRAAAHERAREAPTGEERKKQQPANRPDPAERERQQRKQLEATAERARAAVATLKGET